MNNEVLTSQALEALLRAPSLSVTAVDAQGCVLLWSPSAVRMFGWTEPEVLGHPLPIVPQAQFREFLDRIQEAIKGESVIALEARRLRKDGALIDMNVWTAPLKDNEGNIIGLLGVHADVTARKQAEGAQQQAEAELRRVLGAVSDCVYSGEFDSDGRFFYHYYSPAAERILGRPPLFFLAGPERWLSAVHPEDRPRLAQAFARMQGGESPAEEEEYRIVLPDGTIRWVRDSAVMSQETDGRRFVNGVVSDITARKQTEVALRDSELELRRVLGAVSDYLWSGEVDPEGRFHYRYYSPAVERITGRPADFYMPGSERWMSTVHPDDRARLFEISERLLSGKSVSSENEHRIVLPNGTIRWVRAKVTVSQLADGHRRLDGVVSDITGHKQSEDALRENERELRRVLDAASDYFWSGDIDPEGGFRYRYYSPAVERITGRPAEFYMVGPEKWMSTVHPEDRARLTEISERLRNVQSASDEYEYRIVLPDGTIRWVLSKTVISPPVDGHRRVDGVVSDITARKQSEEALRESEARFRRIFTDSASGIVLVSPEGRFRQANPAFCEFLGYSEQEMLSKTILDVTHPDDRQQSDKFRRSLWKGEKSQVRRYEKRYLRKDGQTVWGEVSMSLLRDAAGNAVYSIAHVLDITERKRAEAAARETEERFRALIEHSFDVIALIEADGTIKFVSDSITRVLGYQPHELVGGDTLELAHPDDLPHAIKVLNQLIEAGKSTMVQQFRCRHRDGSWRWIEVSGTNCLDRPVVDGIILNLHDITERKRADEILRESEERYRLMVEAIPQLVWKANPDGEALECNSRWYEYTGLTPEETRGFSWKKALHPDDMVRVIQTVQKAMAGAESYQMEHRLRRASDGTYRWHLARALPIKDKDGQVLCWIGSAVDIDDQKRAQELLEERVRERTAELTNLNKALRESEAKYRSLVEQIPAITYTAELKAAKALYISPQIEKTLGYTQSDFQKNPDIWMHQVHPHDHKRVMAEISRTHKTGEPFDCEYRLLHRNGKIIWVRDRASIVHDETGRPIFVQGIMLDVTERQQAEETMRLQSTALEAAANAIVISDHEGLIVWANPAFTELTGYELSEVIGKELRVLRSYKHDKAFYENLWQTPLSGRVWHGEIINKRKDGSLYTEEETVTPVRDAAGEIAHFIFIKQDITERKSAEESRQHLAAIVESSGDAIFAGDFNGTIASWNAGAERLYNYTAEEILGRSVSVLVPRDRQAELREIIKKLHSGEHIRHYETVRLKKGRIPVAVSITASPIKNEAGQIIGISAITRDISEQKELEKAVVEAGSREQNRIGRDLHDGLCQQLTGIGFLWKAIVQRQEVRALLDAAAVEEMSQLITKTIGEGRDLARGLCPVELERNDLGVALKRLGSSMEQMFPVSCVVRCQKPVLLTDKTAAAHLYRIAQEAISNAIRHGKAARVWIHLTLRKNRLTLRIRDNGSGFSRRRGLKEGIGMRSMQYRAQAIGGSLTIESKRGVGTTVACVYTQPSSRVAGKSRRRAAV